MSADLDLDALREQTLAGYDLMREDALALLDRVKTAEQERDAAREDIVQRKIRNTLARMADPNGQEPVTIAAWRENVIGWKERAEAAEARLAKVQALRDDLDRRGCLSCSSMTGGDALADYLREALGGDL